jgi:hypothetical protein
VLLFVTGIAVPLGLLLPRTTLDYARLRACATKLVAIGVRRR